MSDPLVVEFQVSGRPRSTQTGSVVRAGGRLIPIRRNTSWSAVVGLVARQHAPAKPFAGPVIVTLCFFLPRPKGRCPELPYRRPDGDNLSKGLLDSFAGVLYEDDAQSVDTTVSKRYADRDHPVGLTVRVVALQTQ